MDNPNTVDLTGKLNDANRAAKPAADFSLPKKNSPAAAPRFASKPNKPSKLPKPDRASRAEAIDQIYDDRLVEVDETLQKIDQPLPRKTRGQGDAYKKISIILGLAFLSVSAYFLFFQDRPADKNKAPISAGSGWYSVKLLNNEVYYGQIADLSADPLVIENVYYNYDQLSAGSAASSSVQSGGNLRLVKRGKEVHGPDGSLRVVRAQVVYMEPMKEDSKVLKAILEYEK